MQNAANVCLCACRKRRLIKGYKLSYTTGFIVCLAFLHAVRRMSLDSWALGCPGSGNILFQRRMSSFFSRTNGIPERRSRVTACRKPDLPVTHSSPFSTWLSAIFFPAALKPRCQGRVMGFFGDGVNIAIALPYSSSVCLLYCKNQSVYGISLSIFLCLPEASVSRREN